MLFIHQTSRVVPFLPRSQQTTNIVTFRVNSLVTLAAETKLVVVFSVEVRNERAGELRSLAGCTGRYRENVIHQSDMRSRVIFPEQICFATRG